MKLKSMLLNKEIPLYIIDHEMVFILLGLKVIKEYDTDGKPTENITGFRYTVVNTDSFEKYEIKVEGTKPLISAELLAEKRENGEKVYVEFENATLKMYWNSRLNAYADSFKADGIHFVETEE